MASITASLNAPHKSVTAARPLSRRSCERTRFRPDPKLFEPMIEMRGVGLAGRCRTVDGVPDARTLSRSTIALQCPLHRAARSSASNGFALSRNDSLLIGPSQNQVLALSSALNSWWYCAASAGGSARRIASMSASDRFSTAIARRSRRLRRVYSSIDFLDSGSNHAAVKLAFMSNLPEAET